MQLNETRLLHAIANELPVILRQLDSADPVLGAAAVQRLRDFSAMTEPLRAVIGARRVSRRGLLRAGAGVATFAAMSVGRDD